jgi:hypothetical protein
MTDQKRVDQFKANYRYLSNGEILDRLPDSCDADPKLARFHARAACSILIDRLNEFEDNMQGFRNVLEMAGIPINA